MHVDLENRLLEAEPHNELQDLVVLGLEVVPKQPDQALRLGRHDDKVFKVVLVAQVFYRVFPVHRLQHLLEVLNVLHGFLDRNQTRLIHFLV